MAEASKNDLERVIQLLTENPTMIIEIGGHTDNQGSYLLNLDLSKKRAEVVKNYLIDQGVDKNRVTSKGYGPTQPIASNASEDTRKLNRRVEFKVLKK